MSGIITDLSMVQFRMLNKSKGPAVWSPRAQCDRMLFTLKWREAIEGNHNVDIWQDSVVALSFDGDRLNGVVTRMGVTLFSKTVVLTVGTFGNGLIHVGRVKMEGGRMSEARSTGLTEQLLERGVPTGRMKTGTPARIDGRSIDFSGLEEQKGDADIRRFSFLKTPLPEKQLSCFITYTNEDVHDELRKGFEDSPLYNGTIKGVGPRYCPSIEDKIVTFGERDHHQLFLEPEGWHTNEYYINGFSSSLPLDVQYAALMKIKGLENLRMYRPGYAIEYDFYLPTALFHSLESKIIENVFFAGQINGTTGYEEAGAQGLMAGINAARKVQGLDAFVLGRDDAYIGVLIDDLVTKGVDEPYRMFTSRAEYRVLLRQDNADERLTPHAIRLGLATEERRSGFENREGRRRVITTHIKETSVEPDRINGLLNQMGSAALRQKVKMIDVLLRPEISVNDLNENGFFQNISGIGEEDQELLESIEIQIKYQGYIQRERLLADKMKRLEGISLDRDIDYGALHSISTEGRQKLGRIKPETIGQASRISGISPSDINVLLLYMGR
jgi:tRNA uridine 5-carboxymethylaminomethyl modification enzyme